jgi:hypothetical protein
MGARVLINEMWYKHPPGEERQRILKEIGRFRVRFDALSVRSGQSEAAK